MSGEYIGLDEKFGYWRDTYLCIEGRRSASLAVRFVLDYRNYAAKENLFWTTSCFEIPHYVRSGHDPVRIISSGPDSQIKMIHDNYLHLIQCKTSCVHTDAVLFYSDDSIFGCAENRASRSGIDVRIMVPETDHPFVLLGDIFLYRMVEAGAKCYVYDNGFLRAKTLRCRRNSGVCRNC